MLRLVIVLCLSVGISADYFVERYGREVAARNCIGDEAYLSLTTGIAKAAKACQEMPVSINMDADEYQIEEIKERLDLTETTDEGSDEGSGEGEEESNESSEEMGLADPWKALMDLFRGASDESQTPVIFPVPLLYLPRGRQSLMSRRKREVLYDSAFLKGAISEARAKVSNFTCTLQQMDVIDGNYTINMDKVTAVINLTDTNLQKEVVQALNQCYEFTKCLPMDMSSPLPKSLQRVFVFSKCSKMARLVTCMKHDIKRHLDVFDVTGLPKISDADDDKKADVLLHIFWGNDSTDFEIY